MQGVPGEPEPLVDGSAASAVPPAVRQAAEAHGLGDHVDVRHEVPMSAALVRGGATAIVGGTLMVLVSYLAADESIFSWTYSLLRFVVLFLFFLTFAGALYAVRGLVVGSRSHHLFAGGLVHQRRSGPRAVAWPDVESLQAVRRGRGADSRVLGYQVRVGGRPLFVVPLVLTAGRDPFIDRVVERLRAHGRPVQ